MAVLENSQKFEIVLVDVFTPLSLRYYSFYHPRLLQFVKLCFLKHGFLHLLVLIQFQLLVETFCFIFKPGCYFRIIIVSFFAPVFARLELSHCFTKFCQYLFRCFTAIKSLLSEFFQCFDFMRFQISNVQRLRFQLRHCFDRFRGWTNIFSWLLGLRACYMLHQSQ